MTEKANGNTTMTAPEKADPSHQARTSHAAKAMREAKQRQKQLDLKAKAREPEKNGPPGPDPARYGDWEVKGIASDF